MSNFSVQSVYMDAKKWILEAGEILRQSIGDPLIVDTKSNPNDLVTEMDKKIEQFFVDKIRAQYAKHKILSEEGFGDELVDLDGVVWIVDPIDGTMNFVHQKRNFAISVAVYHNGIGEIGLIYDVMQDVLYHAIRGEGAYKGDVRLPKLERRVPIEESLLTLNSVWCAENERIEAKKIQQLVRQVRGVRAYGSAALEFSYVAEGIVDSYLSMKLHPWDFAAGIVLVNEVGGITTQATGGPINMMTSNSVFTGNVSLKDEIVKYVKFK